ncbi:MAG: type I-C CRISPR-associated protein Cas8c/Csd1 [Flavobacteriales bacterium]|nr:type I-C CRISPR-associated protein Cas8c/Csd1 [Flavobacteriales bacterium]
MSWIEKLYETYDNCDGRPQFAGHPLLPISHTTQKAHIEIVIGEDGSFISARALTDDEAETLMPCTEAASGRTGQTPVNFPLIDKLQYVAGDFVPFGGEPTVGFANNPTLPHQWFLADLRKWVNSPFTHPKLTAIEAYVSTGTLMADLVGQKVLLSNGTGGFLKKWEGEKKEAPALYQALKEAVEDAVVRWRVQTPGVALSSTWEDPMLIKAWIDYYNDWKTENSPSRLCMVKGHEAPTADMHPTKIRSAGDKAKLISSNDDKGFTFRGRFADPETPSSGAALSGKLLSAAEQACTVSYEVSQKSHLALRWLVDFDRRQAFRNGSQVFVAWEYSGISLPQPFLNTFQLFSATKLDTGYIGDAGQAFGQRMSKFMNGYRQELGNTAGIAVIGIDCATGNQGRMSILYYRELTGSGFLDQVEAWHTTLAWMQHRILDMRAVDFLGAPAPNEIAEAAYGSFEKDKNKKLLKATIERLVPCIIEGRALPKDIVDCAVRRACNRTAFKNEKVGTKAQPREHAWEQQLGIACSLYKGWNKQHTYQMGLEEERRTRDYLYGRLLAIADFIEGRALNVAGEKRDTNAARNMQRFAERPYSTWVHIEKSLVPYQQRLNAKRHGFLKLMKKELDAVHCLFIGDDYRKDSKLDGEFLLAFHCQRQRLWDDENARREKSKNQSDTNDETTN